LIELFLHQGKRERLGNLLDKHFHIAYTLHNLLFVVLMQFAGLYIHPKEPFPEHLLDKLEHIANIQYNYRKS
jgi:hypothetical protein